MVAPACSWSLLRREVSQQPLTEYLVSPPSGVYLVRALIGFLLLSSKG